MDFPVRARIPQPTLREVFKRIGLDIDRGWDPKVWSSGEWKTERDVLTPEEKTELGFE